MVANILHPSPEGRLLGQNSTFQIMVMLQVKLKGIKKCSKMIANI